jgi:phytanoyl-CoA hydroxylase
MNIRNGNEILNNVRESGVNAMYHGIQGVKNDQKYEYVYCEMNPGDTLLFHPLLIHGSGANLTTSYRKAISCHFAASECEVMSPFSYC